MCKSSLSVTIHITSSLDVSWKPFSISQHVPLSGHDDVALCELRRQWLWIDTKSIITSYLLVWRVNQLGKLINRIPGPGFENACWIAQQASWCQQAFLKPCMANLISKDTHLVFSVYFQMHLIYRSFLQILRLKCYIQLEQMSFIILLVQLRTMVINLQSNNLIT